MWIDADCHNMYLMIVKAKNVNAHDQSDAVLELIGPFCFQFDSMEAILVLARQSQLLYEVATRLGIW